MGQIIESKIKILFDAKLKKIERINGAPNSVEIIVSDYEVYSLPLCIFVNNTPLYPTKYEATSTGIISYVSTVVPSARIQFLDDSSLNMRSITKRFTIEYEQLKDFNPTNNRYPGQNQIMKESASDHVKKIIDSGSLKIESEIEVEWHWCHLIAYSIHTLGKSQKKDNLVCGTSACNGHMINIESAVKKFVNKHKRPLSIEVTATIYENTNVAKRIRYRVHDNKGSKLVYTEYFDALTDVKTHASDFYNIYLRMENCLTN